MKKNNQNVGRMILPGAEQWELWVEAEGSGQWQRQAPEEGGFPESAPGREGTLLGLPVLHAVTSVFRVPRSETESLSELAALHLEGMGVYRENGDGGRLHGTLVLDEKDHDDSMRVLAFCQDAPQEEGSPASWDVETAVPAAFCWDWPGDGMVLWRELGRWQVAVVEDGKPIHFQTLSAMPGEPQWVTELTCIGQALSLKETSLRSIEAVWVAAGDEWQEAIEGWASLSGVDFRRVPPLTPKMPPEGIALVTPQMARAASRRKTRRRQRQVLSIAAAVAALLVAWGVVQMLLLQSELDEIEARVGATQSDSQRLQQVQREWLALERWMSNDGFPLEVLLQLHRVKPTGEIRFTEFMVEADGDVFLRGITSRPDQALAYAGELRRAQSLSAYQWETPYPTIRDNDTAEFRFNGIYRYKPSPVQSP